MIGDADLNILQEGNSMRQAPEVVSRVWQRAADMGYERAFIPRSGYDVTDDHVPLLNKGLRVIDVIDLDYGPMGPNGQAIAELPSHDAGHDGQDLGEEPADRRRRRAGVDHGAVARAAPIRFTTHAVAPNREPRIREAPGLPLGGAMKQWIARHERLVPLLAVAGLLAGLGDRAAPWWPRITRTHPKSS